MPHTPGMFCAWKKSPASPCTCAYLLRGSMTELLNHLCCLGQGTLVLRQQGLSLAKSTPFGLWISSRESGWQILSDHLSGLEADTRRPQSAYRRPRLPHGSGRDGGNPDLDGDRPGRLKAIQPPPILAAN